MPITDRIEWSNIYTALAHDERRELLRYLQAVQASQFEDLAQQLLKQESGSAEEKSDAIRIRLHHMHLPMLAEAGLLTWDSQRNRATVTALGTQLSAELIDPSLRPSPTPGERRISD
jgi:hypothetical protein